jgi:DNA-binding transcriptional ArsR family regulator
VFDNELTSEDELRAGTRFVIGLRHELFHALQVVTDPNARVHPAWRQAMHSVLGRRFHDAFEQLGRAHALWVLLPDVFEPSFLGPTFDELVHALRALPLDVIRHRLLLGVLHDRDLVESILLGERDITSALRKTRPKKREWLAFMGLYPPDPTAPLVRALDLLRTDVATFRDALVLAMTAFWEAGFRHTWEAALPHLETGRAEKERLFAVCSVAEFMRRALVRVEVDSSKQRLRAVRGGYELGFENVAAAFFTPSMFNDRRHWAAYEIDDRAVVHFPVFEPSIAPPLPSKPSKATKPAKHASTKHAKHASTKHAEPELDPALVFRALGDATRFAVATLLAAAPRTAADLCRALDMSRPTMSHHIYALREAGLLEELRGVRGVVLALRRDVLERLSEAAVAKLFTTQNLDPAARPLGRALATSRRRS